MLLKSNKKGNFHFVNSQFMCLLLFLSFVCFLVGFQFPREFVRALKLLHLCVRGWGAGVDHVHKHLS